MKLTRQHGILAGFVLTSIGTCIPIVHRESNGVTDQESPLSFLYPYAESRKITYQQLIFKSGKPSQYQQTEVVDFADTAYKTCEDLVECRLQEQQIEVVPEPAQRAALTISIYPSSVAYFEPGSNSVRHFDIDWAGNEATYSRNFTWLQILAIRITHPFDQPKIEQREVDDIVYPRRAQTIDEMLAKPKPSGCTIFVNAA